MYTPCYNFFPMFLGGSPQKVDPARPGHHDAYNGNPFLDSDTCFCERLPDGSWSAPQPCGFNRHYGDACGMPSRCGRRFYYLTQTRPQEEPVHGGRFPTTEPTLHVVEKKDDGTWGDPVDLGLAAGQEDHAEWFRDDNSHISADERTIWSSYSSLVSSSTPGGSGTVGSCLSYRQSLSSPALVGRLLLISVDESARRERITIPSRHFYPSSFADMLTYISQYVNPGQQINHATRRRSCRLGILRATTCITGQAGV